MAVKEVRVGLIGYNFMGRAHSNAYRQVPFFFPDAKAQPVMQVLCGRNRDKVEAAAGQFGWQKVETDWRRLVERDDVDLVDITAPNNEHVEMAIAAAQAGKHVFCEKPLSTDLAGAERAYAAVVKAGCINMVCHNYRRVPAVALAKKMVDNGDLGQIYHWRSQYLQDWLMSSSVPMMWRVQKAIAGSGSLGDLMAHSIDLALWLLGPIESVSCAMKTFIKERPVLEAVDSGLGGRAMAGAAIGEVDVDDGVIALAHFSCGALGTFEATRFAAGHKNYNWFEVNGSKGSLVFNLERMNELQYYRCADPGDRTGFRVIQATESVHPYMAAGGDPSSGPRFWPVAHIIGYEHTFINLVYDLMNAIATGVPTHPTFVDGVKTQAVLDACERSAGDGQWANPFVVGFGQAE